MTYFQNVIAGDSGLLFKFVTNLSPSLSMPKTLPRASRGPVSVALLVSLVHHGREIDVTDRQSFLEEKSCLTNQRGYEGKYMLSYFISQECMADWNINISPMTIR